MGQSRRVRRVAQDARVRLVRDVVCAHAPLRPSPSPAMTCTVALRIGRPNIEGKCPNFMHVPWVRRCGDAIDVKTPAPAIAPNPPRPRCLWTVRFPVFRFMIFSRSAVGNSKKRLPVRRSPTHTRISSDAMRASCSEISVRITIPPNLKTSRYTRPQIGCDPARNARWGDFFVGGPSPPTPPEMRPFGRIS